MRERNRAIGYAEGYAIGFAEGALQVAHNSIIIVLSETAGAIPIALAMRIFAISDLSKLRMLLRAATHVKSCEEFGTKLDNLI